MISMPRSAASVRAFTAVTPDVSIVLKRPTSTALTIMSLRPADKSP